MISRKATAEYFETMPLFQPCAVCYKESLHCLWQQSHPDVHYGGCLGIMASENTTTAQFVKPAHVDVILSLNTMSLLPMTYYCFQVLRNTNDFLFFLC